MKFALRWFVLASLSLVATPTQSSEVANVIVSERVVQRICPGDSVQLILNGAGIRRSWFIDVYIGALYLTKQTGSAEAIIHSPLPKRLSIHVMIDEIRRETLIKSWRNGIEANHTAKELAHLKERLDFAFSTFFTDSVRGDEITIDYTPCIGTVVTVNGEKRGVVPGEDFHRALLKVWLGEMPADRSLKKALLGPQTK